MKPIIEIFNQNVEKGIIPHDLDHKQKVETLLLIECFLEIEKNTLKIPPSILNQVMDHQLAYPDMYMRTILQEQKKNTSLSIYPKGWFESFKDLFEDNYIIYDQSDISCYKRNPITISIFEFDTIPLLNFKCVSDYISFIMTIYSRNFDLLGRLFHGGQLLDSRIILDQVLKKIPIKEKYILLEFLLYRAHSLQVMQNIQVKSSLLNDSKKGILSKVSFPEEIFKERGPNFYGDLLMRIRASNM